MEYMLLAVIIVLLTFMIKREQDVKQERAELLDRLMAKDFTQYKELTEEPTNYEPVVVSEQDEYWREIEEAKV